MVRAYKGWNGLSTLDFADGKMTKEMYLTVLDNNLRKSSSKIMPSRKFVSLQDKIFNIRIRALVRFVQ